MIFRRQLITAATAIVTVLSLCCLVATEAHTLSDAIVPEATSDTADLLVLADQYSDTADLLTDAASWEKRALAAEGSENKLKSELFGEQAEVTRLKAEVTRLKDAALHPALGKPVGSTGRTPVSHVDSVESKPIHLVDGTIPLLTVNDPLLHWTPYTFFSFGGGTPVKVLVDTGSSITALCPGTHIGSAVLLENEYGCCAYEDSAGTHNGWVGQFHRGSVVLGDQSKLVSDPTDMTVALITSQNTGVCTPDIKGIMGVDYGRDKKYGTPQKAIKNFNGTLMLEGVGKSKWAGCVDKSNSKEFEPSFDGTMMVAADEYKFAFIGVNTHNTGNPVMAFGITTTELLRSAKSVGQADFTSQTGDDNTWYTFSGDVHFAIKNWKVCDDDASKCEYTYPFSPSGNYPAVIDSGTQQIALPSAWKLMAGLMRQSCKSLQEDENCLQHPPPSKSTLEITVGSAKLVLPLSEIWVNDGVKMSAQPIIGFPAFWYYDFLFHIIESGSVGGTLSVFSRD